MTTKLNLGCGLHLLSGFINTDEHVDFSEMEKCMDDKYERGKYKQEEMLMEPGAVYMNAKPYRLPFKKGSFDLVESVETLQWLEPRYAYLAFGEIRRVLKDDGMAKLLLANFDDIVMLWQETMKDHDMDTYVDMTKIITCKTPFTYRSLAHMLYQTGWRDVQIHLYPRDCKSNPPMETIRLMEKKPYSMFYVELRKGNDKRGAEQTD